MFPRVWASSSEQQAKRLLLKKKFNDSLKNNPCIVNPADRRRIFASDLIVHLNTVIDPTHTRRPVEGNDRGSVEEDWPRSVHSQGFSKRAEGLMKSAPERRENLALAETESIWTRATSTNENDWWCLEQSTKSKGIDDIPDDSVDRSGMDGGGWTSGGTSLEENESGFG